MHSIKRLLLSFLRGKGGSETITNIQVIFTAEINLAGLFSFSLKLGTDRHEKSSGLSPLGGWLKCWGPFHKAITGQICADYGV